ncbi:uncharacterized protein LOC110820982 isoform X2 [Carica papaya]|nr:uncharacterized protein LOC110820982 isoform X2 [Carica papaya]
MILMLGFYGSMNLRLAPNTSILLQPNPLFVESLQVQELGDAKPGLVLYGFYKSPSLNVVSTWSETHRLSIPPDSHKEWLKYLNKGSVINISYRLKSANSSIVLAIAQGDDDLARWLLDPKYPNTTLSWNVIYGNGVIEQELYKSSTYYIAVGNLNSKEVEVKLNIRIRGILYNTSEAYYKCTFINGRCGLGVLLPKGNPVVLASSAPEKNMSSEWYIRLSYEPRWTTYIIGIGGLTILMLVAFHLIKQFRSNHEDEAAAQHGEMGPERAPLLSNKDDDSASQGSSYDCASNDDNDLDNHLVAGSIDGKLVQDCENSNNTRPLCAICFDAPRDCFFLPCGHCVACFKCGTRIAEAAGTCPICRRKMKKVRKIFTV